MTDLLYEKRERVAKRTLNRPERMNAISLEYQEGIQGFLERRAPRFSGH